jgi:hypothetical protein
MALTLKEPQQVAKAMQKTLKASGASGRTMILEADNVGLTLKSR